MLTVNKLPGQNIAQIGAGGHITKADYDQALPELETLLKKYPRLRFLFRWTISAELRREHCGRT